MADQPEWKPVVQKIVKELEQAFDVLQKTWEGIGCTRDMRSTYYDQAHSHVKELLNDMVAEAQSKQQLLFANIQDLFKQTTSLYAELQMEVIPKTYDHVPLCKVEQILQTDLQNLECIKKERIVILKELLSKEQEICKKLGCKALNIVEDVVPTEQDLESFKLYLQKQEIEKTHLENVFTDIRRSIIKMMNDLEISPSSPFIELICNNPEEFVLNTNNMTKLKEYKDELSMQIEDTKCCVEKMKEDLLALWKYLDEPDDVCQSFLERHPGYNTNTVTGLAAEIKRCKEKRKENILKYVTQIRYELLNLWDLCKYCEAERNTFAPFFSNTFTEDLLSLHELEVERLRKFYNDNRTIFELLEQRENLITKVKDLLQRANNPDRYHNRGGQLLMEEKERNAIQRKLPKIEAELRKLIKDYETNHNQMFTIYGTSLENVLAESWESVTLERESKKKARKEAKDKSIKKSPLNSSKRTPGMLSVHRGPVLGLSKRKLFSPSPNSSLKRRNKNGDKNKPTITVSKIRRSGRLPKIGQKSGRSSKGGQKRKESQSPVNSVTDTTYNQFQGHMTDREELHSSMLPEQILRSANRLNINKTPVRTPMKPLRKHLSATTTPSFTPLSARKTPHSPRVINTPKLATAPSNLPFIF
ncbi:PREDICTED: protein regulator of cytokinesis 1-like [Acromyrmex echinatior]|uniref:Protein regulator of cytokinesis 1 n=1 Tax=Acromyrmex echinatior TaxID=103372 RepID=F4W6K3_ACREC|nr:PREDICTED: protein regulator of cytokinesis 1-like [Acromyrmex echinatior]EGI70338.1 Protein regulator of cytokinesis 1 [Acromyrmex echinatior]